MPGVAGMHSVARGPGFRAAAAFCAVGQGGGAAAGETKLTNTVATSRSVQAGRVSETADPAGFLNYGPAAPPQATRGVSASRVAGRVAGQRHGGRGGWLSPVSTLLVRAGFWHRCRLAGGLRYVADVPVNPRPFLFATSMEARQYGV